MRTSLLSCIGHFLLTNLLLERLKSSAPCRIINNTALAYQIAQLDLDDLNNTTKEEYNAGDNYGNSKLANMLFTKQMAKELEGRCLTSVWGGGGGGGMCIKKMRNGQS